MRHPTGDGESMKTKISALMDGEIEDHDRTAAFRALRADPALRSDWSDYQCIGAVLRDDGDPAIDLTARVMAALDEEPTVLVPSRRSRGWQRPLLALAASAAGVTLVGVLALSPAPEREATASLAVAPAATSPARLAASPRLQEYLVAHQAHAPVGGTSRSIRTVAMAREGR